MYMLLLGFMYTKIIKFHQYVSVFRYEVIHHREKGNLIIPHVYFDFIISDLAPTFVIYPNII